MIDDNELKQKFFDFGALKYPAKKMASVLRVGLPELEKMLKSGMQQCYDSGADSFDFAMDRKLMEMALGGDLKALHKIESKRR